MKCTLFENSLRQQKVRRWNSQKLFYIANISTELSSSVHNLKANSGINPLNIKCR